MEVPPITSKNENSQRRHLLIQLVVNTPLFLRQNNITINNVIAAEAFFTDFSKHVRTKKERNDSFTLQYATRIMNFIYYAGLLFRIYHPQY